MKIREITFDNFRQFLGTQSIRFATDDLKNVTLIYGANGAGKTTILNAFLWALYGTFSPDLEFPNRLIPNSMFAAAVPGRRLTSSVTLHFEHLGEEYTLRRQAVVVKEGNEQRPIDSSVQLRRVDASGASREEPAPEDTIDQILPSRLSQFFFFNGERMERLVTSGYDEIEEAIKTVLGLTKVERAIRHLPKAQSSFGRELARLAGDQRITELTTLREQLLFAQSTADESRREAAANLASTRRELEAIEENLRAHSASRELQASRDDLEIQRQRSLERLQEAQAELRRVINDQGVVAFLGDLARRSLAASKELRVRGELPAPIKLQFIDDLLADGTCICGTPLAAGGVAHDHVSSWRQKAGLAEAEEAWARVGAAAARVPQEVESLRSKLESLQARILNEDGTRQELDARISEIDAKLGSVRVEEVQRLETRRRECTDGIDALNRQISRHEMEAETAKADLAKVEAELERAKVDDAKGQLVQRRMTAVGDACAALERILAIRTESVRSLLEAKVVETYRRITFKPFVPRLNKEFRLSLHEQVGQDELVVAKSTGENQVLSLAFVGALAALARDRTKEQPSLLGAEGGVFPIVMDAAFASLDDNYRRDISRSLPELAPQVVVMVSKAQGAGVVADNLAAHIGATNVITFRTSKEGQETESIELNGRSYDYVRAGAQEDSADIQEVM